MITIRQEKSKKGWVTYWLNLATNKELSMETTTKEIPFTNPDYIEIVNKHLKHL